MMAAVVSGMLAVAAITAARTSRLMVFAPARRHIP